MDQSQVILNLIIIQNSPDNDVRKAAELEFNNLMAQDPSSVAYVLIQSALNDEFPVDLRQSCLLHLKRLVPKFWSIAFQSFIGPPINQEVKKMIRQKLIELSTSSPHSKLRSGGSYVIVQIASADYPDEWPDLLAELYNMTTDYNNEIGMIGGLTVLNDLFDDLISEEQFWEGGIGFELTNNINRLLSQDSLSAETKTSSIKLYQSILVTLQSPEAFSTQERKNAVHRHISTNIVLLTNLLEKSINKSINATGQPISLVELYFRSYIYKVVSAYLGSFNKRIPIDLKQAILFLLLKDFTYSTKVLSSLVVSEENSISVTLTNELTEPSLVITNLIVDFLQTLSAIQHNLPISSTTSNLFQQFVEDLIESSILPKKTIEEYENDLNSYVTEITGLSVVTSVRDSINELLSELNDSDASQVFNLVIQSISSSSSIKWQLKEAYLYLLESLFMNEDSESIGSNIQLADLLNNLTSFISYGVSDLNHPLVSARCFLLLPKFFEKFESKLSLDSFGIKAFVDMIAFAAHPREDDELFNLVKIGVLVSTTFFKHLMNLGKVIDSSKKKETQLAIFEIALSLMDDSEEDGPALLEAITVAIDIDHYSASKLVVADNINVIDLILKISFKDPANIQLSIDASDCLKTLLKDISSQDYLMSCEKSLPFIFKIIQDSLTKHAAEYSPDLSLALELLSIIIESVPESDEGFPSQIFNYTFPVLKDLLLFSSDNQILQSGGEVFNNLLQKASKLFLNYNYPESKQSGMELLLSIVSKFLSPELSDSAAINCGLIVSSLINMFQQYLGNEFLSQILEATVKRLIIAKEAITIENLIMVFCNLVLTSPEDMINFLSNNIRLQDPNTGVEKSALELILPIWFDSFEVTRGYEKIKQNALALAKIFTLGHEKVESLIVNGDIIPYQGDLIITRSIARQMPDQYTQISASQKILKLLISELNFQCQQPNANDYLPEVDENASDNDENWEDMDDIGVPNFEKLKSYVDSDEEDDEHDDQNGDEALKNILVQFFKECITKNLGHFQKFYELLDEDEKKIVTENVVF